MLDALVTIIEYSEGLKWIFFICILWIFYRGVRSSELEWWHFISAPDEKTGKWMANLTKLGQAVGIIGVAYTMIKLADNAHRDYSGYSFVLLACLAFLGGVTGYSAYLRAKLGTTTTVKVDEPAPSAPLPTKTTTTTTEPAAPASPALTVKNAIIKAETAVLNTGDKK